MGAIQNRRGVFKDFDPQKMLPGEFGVVTNGDPNSPDGKSVYMCFEAGNVKRMATYDDMVENIQEASREIVAAEIALATGEAVQACEAAAEKAKTDTDEAVKNANTAAANATNAGNKATSDAAAAVSNANEAATSATNKANQAVADVKAAIGRSDAATGNANTAAERANEAAQKVDDALAGVGYSDISDKTVAFTENSSYEIASGETASLLFGKIKKFVNTIKEKAPGLLTHGLVPMADKLFQARKIDGVEFEGTSDISHYGICSTAGSTAAKAVAITGFVVSVGARATVRFTNTNTASNPKLNVNNTTAYAIYYKSAAIPANYIKAGTILELVFDGSYWRVVGEPTQAQVDELKTNVSSLIKVSTLTLSSMSLDAGWDGRTTGTTAAMTGYTPIMVTPEDAGASDVCWETCSLSGTTVTAKLKNTTTVAKSGFSPTVSVLYFKNS